MPPLPGEKAVANYDEDSITMAVAAAMATIAGTDAKNIDGLYFASTTSPYKEKQGAATVAAALDLKRDAFTADFSGSLRAGTNAMRAAIDALSGGSGKRVLVCTADTRIGLPKSEKELSFGDGAAAVLLGGEKGIASIEGSYTIADELLDVWRSDKDSFVRSWEDRFVREAGYIGVVVEAVSSALKKYGLTPNDFSKAVFYAPNARDLTAVAQKLGFDAKTQVQPPLYNEVGNTGTAHSLMLLAAALAEAKAGDRLLLASYGDGCDVFILRVTEEIENVRSRRGVKDYLASKQVLPKYQKYLMWREVVPVEPQARPPLEQPSPVGLWRDRKGLALCGVRCKHCGTPQYPAQRICMICQTKDEFEDYPFAGKIGKLFTFSHDNLAASIDTPSTSTVVDFEGGGRIMCEMTDRDPAEVKVGMPVEMTFRRLRYVGGIYDYWWKCRPVRDQG
jgi:3-hydroxy-3-methylglutaryl CoA synthase